MSLQVQHCYTSPLMSEGFFGKKPMARLFDFAFKIVCILNRSKAIKASIFKSLKKLQPLNQKDFNL